MPQHLQTIALQIQPKDTLLLQKHYQQLLQQLEKGRSLRPSLVADLRQKMREVLDYQTFFAEIWSNSDYKKHCIHLTHEDKDMLNLPWRLAVQERPLLYLSKGTALANNSHTHQAKASPLKILVMISAPEDGDIDNRLDYEAEEERIILAFEQLYEHGQVEIDFTLDGSLAALQEKLRENHYHILHFSGHGVYKNGEGFLQLEDEFSMQAERVAASTFARAIAGSKHKPDLILLSSCQTAQGKIEEGFKGVTDELLKAEIPAVIAMSFSILDSYASEFAAHFYEQIAKKEALYPAFYAAIQHIKAEEYRQRKLGDTQQEAAQWMIPQLYCTQAIDELLNWAAESEKLAISAFKFAKGTEILLREHHSNYRFLGRRRERKQLITLLRQQQPVLIKGQGGVGKTSFAEHLVQRLIIQDNRYYPFAFTETASLQSIIDRLVQFFEEEENDFFVRDEMEKQTEEAVKQLLWLLKKLLKENHVQPLFVFDNLESFQAEEGGDFKIEYSDVLEAIQLLLKIRKIPVLLTGRYPIPQLEGVTEKDLNQVRFTDFYKKCQQLHLRELQVRLRKHTLHLTLPKHNDTTDAPVRFRDVVRILHRSFGGNYRLLEFFDTLYRDQKTDISPTLTQLADYQAAVEAKKEDWLLSASEDLVFTKLLALLSEQEQAALQLLTQFRVGVLPLALQLQNWMGDAKAALNRLHELTLVEQQHQYYDNAQELQYYSVTSIVRDLLKRYATTSIKFDDTRAGKYFEHLDKYLNNYSVKHLEEAFYHYCNTQNKSKIEQIGKTLIQFYNSIQIYQNVLYFGVIVCKILGDKTPLQIVNYIAKNSLGLGHYEQAFNLFSDSLEKARIIEDKEICAVSLYNIGVIYLHKGLYEEALYFLEEANNIEKVIGGSGAVETAIGSVYKAIGEYDKASNYWDIAEKKYQLNDNKAGLSSILNNRSHIYRIRGNLDLALDSLKKSLVMKQGVFDLEGEGAVLNNIGQIFSQMRQHAKARRYFEKSLLKSEEIGEFKGMSTALGNIGDTFYQEYSYDDALPYFDRALEMQKQIGYTEGVMVNFYRKALIFYEKRQRDDFFEYAFSAYSIAQETKNADGLLKIGQHLGSVLCENNDKNRGLPMLQQSYAIAAQNGLPQAAELQALINKYS